MEVSTGDGTRDELRLLSFSTSSSLISARAGLATGDSVFMTLLASSSFFSFSSRFSSFGILLSFSTGSTFSSVVEAGSGLSGLGNETEGTICNGLVDFVRIGNVGNDVGVARFAQDTGG